MAKIGIIGGGISGLSAACFAAKDGHEVTLYEKNETLGGRSRKFSAEGFMFDMGPSWYWMPDVPERFFKQFGQTAAYYYDLVKLDPGFRIFFKEGAPLDIPADQQELHDVFEAIEPGSSKKLSKYLVDAEFKYKEGMLKLAIKPSLSLMEFADPALLLKASRLSLFKSISTHVRKYFKDERLIALMEFPVLFLGAMPRDVPSLYSLMNYAALVQGTWYPKGGMHQLINGMHQLALSLGVTFKTGHDVKQVITRNNAAQELKTDKGTFNADAVIAACDYHHAEQMLLGEQERNYTEKYWSKKTFAPSCLIFYLGVNRKIDGLLHHNLFFDADFDKHAGEIYKNPAWPADPLFYVCCPSRTDDTVAPEGCENLFVLIPVATGLEDNKERENYYYDLVLKRIEQKCEISIRENVIYKSTYTVSNFKQDYNAYKGNAYGLANTLSQTAVLKPRLVNKRIKNLFYAGQLTVPGPGIPPCIISGELAAKLTNDYIKSRL